MKLVFHAEFAVNGKVATVAEQAGCLIDMSSGQPVPVPEDLYRMYSDFQG